MNKFLISIVTLAAVAASASAALSGNERIAFTRDNEVFVLGPGGSVSAGTTIHAANTSFSVPGIAYNPFDGNLWISNGDDNSFYTIDLATGAATLQFGYGGTIGGVNSSIISFEFRSDNAGGFELFGMQGDVVRVFDDTGSEVSAVDTGRNSGFPSTAYVGGTYYGIRTSDQDLFEIDPDTGATTNLGNVGNLQNFSLAGGDGNLGVYWAGAQVNNQSELVFGTVDVGTTQFNEVYRFTDVSNGGSMGLATFMIPSPAASFLGVIGFGAVAGLRRRFAA